MSKDYARSLDKIHHKIRAHLLSLLRRSSLSAEPDSAAVLVLFAVAELRTKPDNKVCADCAMRDPTWASANLGVFLCLDCSGVHRSLGVHITQVRSITMDAWFPDQIKTMQTVGNAKARAFWEANVPAGHSIPNEDSSRAEMEVWIKDKYQNKKFVAQQPMSALTPNPVPRQCATHTRARCPAAPPHSEPRCVVLRKSGGGGGGGAARASAGPAIIKKSGESAAAKRAAAKAQLAKRRAAKAAEKQGGAADSGDLFGLADAGGSLGMAAPPAAAPAPVDEGLGPDFAGMQMMDQAPAAAAAAPDPAGFSFVTGGDAPAQPAAPSPPAEPELRVDPEVRKFARLENAVL